MSIQPLLTRGLAVATAASLLAGYQFIAHRVTVSSDPAFWQTLWAIAPLAGLSLWLAGRWRRPGIVIALTLSVLVGLVEFWPQIRGHQDWIYWLQHFGVNLLMMFSMGSSLLPGRQPLCSRFAAQVRGHLGPAVLARTHFRLVRARQPADHPFGRADVPGRVRRSAARAATRAAIRAPRGHSCLPRIQDTAEGERAAGRSTRWIAHRPTRWEAFLPDRTGVPAAFQPPAPGSRLTP